MPHLLAYAETAEPSSVTLWLVLLGLGVVLVVAVVVAIPMALARRRGAAAGAITAMAFLWGLVAAASVFVTMLSRFRWATEQDRLLRTGYYDPLTAPPAPGWPWWLWVVLAAGYALLVLWAGRRPAPPSERVG